MLFVCIEPKEPIRRGGQVSDLFAKKTCILLKDLNLR